MYLFIFSKFWGSWHTKSCTIKIVQFDVLAYVCTHIQTYDLCTDSLPWIQKFSWAPCNTMKCTFHVLLPAMPQPLLSVSIFLLLSLWISLHFLSFIQMKLYTMYYVCLVLVWLFSFSIIILRFIHVVAFSLVHFFLLLNSILLYG